MPLSAQTWDQQLAAIRAAFEESGVTIAEWARANGFSSGLVYQVLDGRRRCVRGQCRKIAIALGLKHGRTMDVAELSRRFVEGQPLSLPDQEAAM
jgi:gp16 family phage-associated protein